jgi:hypothetical protein
MKPIRHATLDGKMTLCGLYGGFHDPKPMVKPIQGWTLNVTCGNCRKSLRFREATE